MANTKGREWKTAAEEVHVSGWRWAISVDGFGLSAEMRTLGSPKFSSQFEHVGGSRLGHSLLPSKAHQRLVKADYR